MTGPSRVIGAGRGNKRTRETCSYRVEALAGHESSDSVQYIEWDWVCLRLCTIYFLSVFLLRLRTVATL